MMAYRDYIADGTVADQAGGIEILDVVNANQRRDMRRMGQTRPLAGKHSWMLGRKLSNDFILRERFLKRLFAHHPRGAKANP
jgi:hypothetical protein